MRLFWKIPTIRKINLKLHRPHEISFMYTKPTKCVFCHSLDFKDYYTQMKKCWVTDINNIGGTMYRLSKLININTRNALLRKVRFVRKSGIKEAL